MNEIPEPSRVTTRAPAGLLLALLLAAFWAAPASAQPPPRPDESWGRQATLSSFPSRRQTDDAKAVLAGVTCALLALSAGLARRGRPRALGRTRDALLATLGLASAAASVNFFQFHYPSFIHGSEFYHYYVGSKYFAELGYTHLYACAVVADAQSRPGADLSARRLRNLSTNQIETAAEILTSPERCTSRFAPDRWQSFRRDIAWFRSRLPEHRWRRIQLDHGYNPTPAWGILAIPLANTGPISDARIRALALLDPALLLLAAGSVAWAFGWRAMCVAVVFFGTNYFSVFGWTGGAFLRTDWLTAVLCGICLLRRDRPLAGGMLLGWAAMLRVFPVLILGGVALQAAVAMVRGRRLLPDPPHRRVFVGALLAAGLALPLSPGGPQAWTAFAENSRVLLDTPLRNHVGLATVLAYSRSSVARKLEDPSLSQPLGPWREARRANFAERRVLFAAILLAFTALVARGAAGREPWIAAALGIGLIPFATELTCYYWTVLTGSALLWVRRPGVGVALCGLSAATWIIAGRVLFEDEVFTFSSLAALAFATYGTLAFAGSRVSPAAKTLRAGSPAAP